MRRDRLPDGRRLCDYCRCYAPPEKIEKLANGVYRCRRGHGCAASSTSDEAPKSAHLPPNPRPVRPHIPGFAPIKLRLPRVEDLFPWIERRRRREGEE